MSSYNNKPNTIVSRLKTSLSSAIFTLLIYAIIVNFAPIPIANIFLNPLGVVAGVQYSQEKAMASERENSSKKIEKALVSQKDEIFDKSAPYIGSENAALEIVMFTDYKCGYCKAFDEVAESVLKNPEYKEKVKFIIKELPVLGNSSLLMAMGALEAFNVNPSSYKKVHKAFYNSKASSKEEIILIAEKLNVKITLDDNPSIKEKVNSNLKLAQSIGIRGTPAIIIGKEFIPGFIDEKELISRIQRELKK